MKSHRITFLVLAIVFLFASSALAAHHAVKIAHKDGVGNYLTDTEGMALYWFTKDSAGMSACADGCLQNWPAFYRDSVKAPAGVSADDFATITRADGAMQTTFRGYPLYYFVKDKAAGDTTGEGVKGVWYVIDPAAFPK